MFRRLAAILLIALALATLAVYARAVMAPLTLSIGSGEVALVQSGPAVLTGSLGVDPSNVPGTFAAPSTAGTCLIFVAGGITGTISSMPAGWVNLVGITGTSRYEVWAYLNNPGGISAVTAITTFNNGTWSSALSEWSGVRSLSAIDTSGTASSVGGTTLAVSSTGNVSAPGELALVGWNQRIGIAAAVTFTSPTGWTRVIDNGSDATTSHHIDLEYLVNPPMGILTATLTSNTATNPSAAGAVVVLKAAPPVTDQTAYIAY